MGFLAAAGMLFPILTDGCTTFRTGIAISHREYIPVLASIVNQLSFLDTRLEGWDSWLP
jgi:hypothetical protein